MTHLISNPPKYELEDGSIQVWRGMPKLPDVVDVMLNFRVKAGIDALKRAAEQQKKEDAEEEKRRAEHPEEFIGMKELQEIAQKIPLINKKPSCPSNKTEAKAAEPTLSSYAPSKAELERKKQEAIELAKKFS